MTRSGVLCGSLTLTGFTDSYIWPSGRMLMDLLAEPELFLLYDVIYIWEESFAYLQEWLEWIQRDGEPPHELQLMVEAEVIRPLRMPTGTDRAVEEVFASVLAGVVEEQLKNGIHPDWRPELCGLFFELEKARQARRRPILGGAARFWTPYLPLANDRDLVRSATVALASDSAGRRRRWHNHQPALYVLGEKRRDAFKEYIDGDDLLTHTEATLRRRSRAVIDPLDRIAASLAPDLYIEGGPVIPNDPSQLFTSEQVINMRESYGRCFEEMRAVARETLRVTSAETGAAVEELAQRLWKRNQATIDEVILDHFPWARRVHRALSSRSTALAVESAAFAAGAASGVPLAVPGLGMLPAVASNIPRRFAYKRAAALKMKNPPIQTDWYFEWMDLERDLSRKRR